MAKTEGTSAANSSTHSWSEKHEGAVSGHAAGYAKVYTFFSFGHTYNFPLCIFKG